MALPSGDVTSALDRDGAVVLDGVLTQERLDAGRRLLDDVYARAFDPALDAPGYSIDSGAAGRPILGLPDGSRFVTNLISKDPFFADLVDEPVVMPLVRRLIDDPLLSSLNSLEPLRGTGHQVLHRDEGPVGADGVVTVNTLWLFDDVDRRNGATRYVPGTHRTDELAEADDPRIRYLEAPAGSVVVMNAHTLHGASTNLDGRRRRIVHVYFTRRGRQTQTDWRRYVPDDVRAALSPSRLALLGLQR